MIFLHVDFFLTSIYVPIIKHHILYGSLVHGARAKLNLDDLNAVKAFKYNALNNFSMVVHDYNRRIYFTLKQLVP